MVIDFEEKCRSLGVDLEDYKEANKRFGRAMYDIAGKSTFDEYIDAIKSVGGKPLIAMIRVDGLYERYPKIFDFDGPIPGVEAPYPYAGRDDGE